MDTDNEGISTARSGSFMHFLRAPIWGLTGRLSLRQSHEAAAAKDARLLRTGGVEDAERHVREGHADRRDLLGWATDVTSRGREERRRVMEEVMRTPSPLRRRTERDFEEVHRRENESARRRSGEVEDSEMIFERAMERSRVKREREKERLRKEKDRLEELWTPRDVTVRDSGIGSTGSQTPDDGEKRRNGSEEGRPGAGDERGNYEEVRAADGDGGPHAMSKLEVENRGIPSKDVKEEVEKMAIKSGMEEEIRDIKGSESVLEVQEQAAEEAKEEQRRVEERTVKAINEMQDIDDARNMANMTASPPMVAARLVRGDSETMVDGVVRTKVPDQGDGVARAGSGEVVDEVEPPAPLTTKREMSSQHLQTEGQTQHNSAPAEKWAQGVEGPAARNINDVSPKNISVGGDTVTDLPASSSHNNINTSAQNITSSNPRSPKSQDLTQSTSDTARAGDDISPKSQPAGATIEKPLEISDSVTGQDDLGQVKGPVREKWGKGREGEDARATGGVSPKSGGLRREIVEGAGVAGCGGSEEGDGKGDSEKGLDGEKGEREGVEQTAAQRRTERWVGGDEGEGARNEGTGSTRRAGLESVGVHAAPHESESENGSVSMKSAKSHVTGEE